MSAEDFKKFQSSPGFHGKPNRDGGKPVSVSTALEISTEARRRVRKMFRVLDEIAFADGKEGRNAQPAAARVNAAKFVIETAHMDKADISKLSPKQLLRLADKVVALQQKKPKVQAARAAMADATATAERADVEFDQTAAEVLAAEAAAGVKPN